MWRSTDYGSSLELLFEHQSTKLHRCRCGDRIEPDHQLRRAWRRHQPSDLSMSGGMSKFTDAGMRWIHLGLRDAQMIADAVVDP